MLNTCAASQVVRMVKDKVSAQDKVWKTVSTAELQPGVQGPNKGSIARAHEGINRKGDIIDM